MEGIEVFEAAVLECEDCGCPYPDYAGAHKEEDRCNECGGRLFFAEPARDGWWWWSCQPGCLPDGEPSGPFDTEAEAEADAKED